MSFDPAPYIAYHLEENRREKEAIKQRLALALSEAERLAVLLKELPGVEAVYFFGSAARGDSSRLDFDLDLALVGGDLYHGLDIVENSSFAVDLVELDRLPEGVRQQVVSSGIRLF